MYITLKEARKHLNLDDFFHEDDELITEMIRQAEEATALRVNRPLHQLVDPDSGCLSPSVKAAVLLLVGTLYSNREATSPQQVQEIPLGFSFLADLNRKIAIG